MPDQLPEELSPEKVPGALSKAPNINGAAPPRVRQSCRGAPKGTKRVSKFQNTQNVQGARNLWGQRISAYFVLKVAPQRGEGEKKEGVQISKNITQNL